MSRKIIQRMLATPVTSTKSSFSAFRKSVLKLSAVGLSALMLASGSTQAIAQNPCCPPVQSYQADPCQPDFYPASPAPMMDSSQSNQTLPPEYFGEPVPSAPVENAPLQDQSQAQAQNFPQDNFADNFDSAPSNVDLSSGLATNFGSGGGSSLAFSEALSGASSVGYIDSALVRNQIRFRFDASYDNPTPDRAEFFYPQCGCFGPQARGPGNTGEVETGVDYQEFSLYAESLVIGDRLSAFVELPFRLINPEVNDNTGGLSDISLGFKAALVQSRCRSVTFQLRTWLPSGDGSKGLGTEHVTLEPGLLFMQRLRGGTTLEGEIRDFIPIDGTQNYAGNVLRYGLGISKTVVKNGNFSITPVFETVAWSVLSGDVLNPNGQLESAETTIVNSKLGARFNLSPRCRGAATKSVYVGYGKALTDDRWYDDTLRAEYRYSF